MNNVMRVVLGSLACAALLALLAVTAIAALLGATP